MPIISKEKKPNIHIVLGNEGEMGKLPTERWAKDKDS